MSNKIENEKELLIALKNDYVYCEETGRFIRLSDKGGQKQGTYAGRISKRGYRELSVKNFRYREHRLVWLYKTSALPRYQIDHLDHDRTNNIWSNLQEATGSQNNRNCSLSSNNTSGMNGVIRQGSFSNGTDRFVAQIKVNYRSIYLGSYDTKAKAELARKHADCIYAFTNNHGDRPSSIVEYPPLEYFRYTDSRSRPVLAFNRTTDAFITEYVSTKTLAAALGISLQSIRTTIREKRTRDGIYYRYKPKPTKE